MYTFILSLREMEGGGSQIQSRSQLRSELQASLTSYSQKPNQIKKHTEGTALPAVQTRRVSTVLEVVTECVAFPGSFLLCVNMENIPFPHWKYPEII